MSAMQVDAAELLHLLESQDLTVVAEIESLIKDNLQSSREAWLLNGLVESYMVSQSTRCMQILATVQEPHDKHLMDRIVEHIKGSGAYRLQALTLFAYIVRRQPGWLYQVAHHSLMSTILKCLKTDSDVPVLMCGVLIIASIVPIIPVAITRHLHDIFEAFSRLVAFNLRKPGNVPDVYLLHLQVGVYALFHRLYGMYPCNFLTYLRATYSKPENRQIFEDLVKPMLERVRMHPLLVTASKDKELAMERWRHKEVHDIMVDCAKMSLDPIEGWSEESLCPVLSQIPHIPPVGLEMGLSPPPTKRQNRQTPAPLLPVVEMTVPEPLPPTLAAQDPLWSPSSVCGLSTPPPLTPVSATVTPSLPEVPPITQGVITPLPCLTSHVDSPLPHDETERRRVAMLNTHLAVQIQANTDGGHPSVPPSPLKPDFTSEPPFHVPPMKAIRKINFDHPPLDVLDGVRGQGSGFRGQEEVVTPAEEALEDIPTAVGRATKATGGAAKPPSQPQEVVPDSLLKDKPHVPASSSVPSVSQLPQFIDSLDVVSPAEDKSEAEDKEVSELTQEGPDDDSTSESSIGVPSHIPANVQMTAESVAAFMKQVNRIRFNSMNVTSQEKHVKERQYSRSTSCPNLKDKAAEIDEATEDHPHGDDAHPDVTDNVPTPDHSDVPTDVTPGDVDVTMTTVTQVTTTIQTQTSVVSTTSHASSDGHFQATSQQQPEVTTMAPTRPETEGERFYRYLMGILLPQPSRCEKCQAREAQELAEKTAIPGKSPGQPAVNGKKRNTIGFPSSRPPIPSPGGVPIYTTMSPPEMLDRHILLGGDVHADELSRIPLTSQANVSWTHFGGVPPADEVNILGGQLLLLHNQLMFERHKSELHAKRNRRLLGRTVKTMALEEQYAAMQDQLRLQENEIQSLSEGLRLQQQANGELRAANDKHVCDRQVLQKSHAEEAENLRLSKEVLQSELRAQKEENDRLCKELQRVKSQMFCVEEELDSVKTKVGQSDDLKDQVTRLNKELLLMGELQQKYQQRLVAVSNSHNAKPETQFVLDSYKAELAAVRLCLDQKNTLLESTRARVAEAEEHCKQKELMLAEDKKLIEHLRLQHKGEIQALEEKYRAQKKIQLGLHSQILELCGQISPAQSQPACPQEDTSEPQSMETQQSLASSAKFSPQPARLSASLGASTGVFSPPVDTATTAPSLKVEGDKESTASKESLAMRGSPATKESPATGIKLHSGSAFKSYQGQKTAESQPEKNA